MLAFGDDSRKKRAAECFKRGTEAMMQQAWDYSCVMFRQCVNLVPENLLYRQTLRGATQKMYKDNRTGAPDAERQLVDAKETVKELRKAKNDWHTVVQACEDGLAINPWDAALNAELGFAFGMLGFTDEAIFAYECAVVQDRENIEFLRALGILYEKQGKAQQAIECFIKINRLDSSDPGARQRIVDLKAPGLSAKGSSLDEPVKAAESAIRLREKQEDAELELLRNAVSQAREAALANPDDNLAKRIYLDAKDELLHREIELYSERIERYPLDMTLRYELALRYMQDKRHPLAIPLLQLSRRDMRLRVQSLVNLGKCLVFNCQYPQALRWFELAVVDCDPNNDPDLYAELQYFIRRVREELDWGGQSFDTA